MANAGIVANTADTAAARAEQMVTLKAAQSLSISVLTNDRLRHVSVIKYRFETKCRNAKLDAASQ